MKFSRIELILVTQPKWRSIFRMTQSLLNWDLTEKLKDGFTIGKVINGTTHRHHNYYQLDHLIIRHNSILHHFVVSAYAQSSEVSEDRQQITEFRSPGFIVLGAERSQSKRKLNGGHSDNEESCANEDNSASVNNDIVVNDDSAGKNIISNDCISFAGNDSTPRFSSYHYCSS